MKQHAFCGRPLTLYRYPRVSEESPLQASDAADEYLLQQPLPPGPVMVINDNFGALTCALYPTSVWHLSDSWLGQQAARVNLRLNQMDEANVVFLDCLSPPAALPAAVLIKLPKSHALLEHQLRMLRKIVTAETVIIAGGKVRDIHSSTLSLFEQIIGKTQTSLAWKKARLIFSSWDAPELPEKPATLSWPLEGTRWHIHNYASVFSRGSLDPGARLFLQHLPQDIEGDIADLGCGNGVVGLTALAQNMRAQVHFIDESLMAVASSRLNVESNCPIDLSRSHFIVNHALEGFSAGSLHAVLCNPPFHQHNTLTDSIAWRMFCDARHCLQRGGELRIVGNRHLSYHHKLKKLFGNCELLASNARFVVLRAVRTTG